jgi:hypothetical protein
LSTGAQGFVHKIRAQSELLPAIELVLRPATRPQHVEAYKVTEPLDLPQ